MEGSVKWFNRMKGYGFIAGEDGKEYFVHASAIAEGTFLRENDRVSFDPDEGEKGPIAKNIALLQKGSEIAQGGEEAPVEEDNSEEVTGEEEAPVEEDNSEEAAPKEEEKAE